MKLVAKASVALLLAGCANVSPISPSGATLTLVASPTSLGVTGGTSTVTVSAFQANGFPVRDDTAVSLNVDLGSVAPQTVKLRGGFASATYTSGTQPGVATITATSGNVPPATVKITIGTSASTIAVTASPSLLPAVGGTSQIAAVVLDAQSQGVSSFPVVFSTTAGSLSSQGMVRTTDSLGRAFDTLQTTLDATVTVRAAAGTVSGSVLVDVQDVGTNLTLKLNASPSSLPAGGGNSTLTVLASNAQTQPLPGVSVVFTTSAGTLTTQTPILTDAQGLASNTLTTNANATVKASASGATSSVSITVAATSNVASMLLGATPSTVGNTTLPGTSACVTLNNPEIPIKLEATVYDAAGTELSGVPVTFSVAASDSNAKLAGNFCVLPPMATTNSKGVATIDYTLSDADVAFCQGLTGCKCCSLRFTALADTLAEQTVVTVLCPAFFNVAIGVSPVTDVTDNNGVGPVCSVANPNTQLPLTLTATVTDDQGNKVQGAAVNFYASRRTTDSRLVGTFCSPTAQATTDVNGVATIDYDYTQTDLQTTCQGVTPAVSCPSTLTCCCGINFVAQLECSGAASATVKTTVMNTGCVYPP